ncbi:MAG TPA: host attachment protein [Polyangiales bacterium]
MRLADAARHAQASFHDRERGTAMAVTRVLVAHDAGARWFDNRGPGKGLILRGQVAFEDGRRHHGELEADRPGSSAGRAGAGRHSYAPSRDAKDQACAHFAKELAADLARDFHAGDFTRLVLVAPPRFLGVLKSALAPQLARALLATVAKDLPRADVVELVAHLGAHFAC